MGCQWRDELEPHGFTKIDVEEVAMRGLVQMAMKTSDREKVLKLAGACTLVLPLMVAVPAVAQPVFDNWSATNGDIAMDTDPNTGYCASAGVSCTTLVSGKGFLQQEVVDTNVGATFIHTIITEANATGSPASLPFTDESFIQQGANSGVMARQRSTESTVDPNTDFQFSNTATLYTGWASAYIPQGEANMNIDQNFTDKGVPAVAGDGLFNSFKMSVKQDNNGNVTGKKMSLRQNLGMGDGQTDNTTDAQSFVVEQISGSMNTAAGSLTLGQTTGTNGGTVSWLAGEDVLVAWLGQQVNTAAPGDPQSLSLFGFESVTNNTTSATASTSSTTQVDIEPDPNNPGAYLFPFDWDAAFGAAPTLTLPPQP